MSSDKTFNISEAARATGKSVMTIRDYLAKSKFPNAFSTPRGKSVAWNIPLTDLVAAGLMDSVKSEPEPETTASADTELRLLVASLEAENRQLRERLAREIQALERAEKRIDQLLPQQAIETAKAQRERRLRWFRRAKPNEFDSMPSQRLEDN